MYQQMVLSSVAQCDGESKDEVCLAYRMSQ
jgi:hypothetical protein